MAVFPFPFKLNGLDTVQDFFERYRSRFAHLSWLVKCSFNASYAFDVEEIKTDTMIEVNATFRLTLDKTEKAYHGKGTRQFQKTRLTKNEKETMEKEAKKAALMEFFKERYGFTEFNDLYVDELHRSIGI